MPLLPKDLGLPEKFIEWRPGQVEIAAKIASSSKYAYLLDAPTGSGKSLIAAAVQRIKGVNTTYVATTKQLQDQLLHDFPYAKTLKGRANYRCLKYYRAFPEITAEDCSHTESNKCELRHKCPYMIAKRQALDSPLAVLNTAYFLTEINYVGAFSGRDFLVIDEVDTLEDQLMSFIKVVITSRQLSSLHVNPPKFKTKFESWVDWARDTLSELRPQLRELESKANVDDTWATIDVKLLRDVRNLKRLVGKLEFFTKEVDKTWIWYPQETMWTFQPVWVARYSDASLWKHTKKVLGMSATILDPRQVSSNVGLTHEGRLYEYKALPSMFPKENRPVYADYAANVTNRTLDTALPRLSKAVEQIMQKHLNDKILCLVPGTLVRTFREYKPIEEIRPGDFVLTSSGHFRPVSQVMVREYCGGVLRIRPRGDLSFAITPEHPVSTTDGWQEAIKITKMSRLIPPPAIKTYYYSPPKLALRGRDWSMLKTNRYFWYIVGLWAAEGSADATTGEIKWAQTNTIVIRKLRMNCHMVGLRTSYNGSSVRSSSVEFARWLKEEVGTNAGNKRVPPFLFAEDCLKEYQEAFIDGYLDGDGSNSSPDYSFTWSSKSASLALGVRDLLRVARQVVSGVYRLGDRGWQCGVSPSAAELVRGDISFISVEEYVGPVYNLSVEEEEDYCLSGACVHNCHTVSYKIRDYLMKHIGGTRLVTHSTANRADVLDMFKKSPRPLVLVSPSMERGIDLPQDECRVVIIAKCVPDSTLAVTPYGLKRRTDLRVGDIVFTLSTDGEIQEQPILRLYQEKYEGPIIRLLGTIHCDVTPDHRVLLHGQQSQQLVYTAAKDVTTAGYWCIPYTGKWIGKNYQSKIDTQALADCPDEGKFQPTMFDLGDFLEYLGWYIAEGHRRVNTVEKSRYRSWSTLITQRTDETRLKILSLCDEMGLRYIISKEYGKDKNIVISGRLFCEAIGNIIPDGACNKRIPRWALSLETKYLSRLFNGLMGGDGSTPEKKSWAYITSSIGLCDDFCELCIKLGYSIKVYHKSPVKHEIYVRRKSDFSITRSATYTYNGIVWCPTTHNGNWLAYNDGYYFFTGNCPYPDLGDVQVSKRLYSSVDGNNWYSHKTISTIVQMSGRAVRSADDYAATYILDEQFGKLYSEHKNMFPAWFKEAVIM